MLDEKNPAETGKSGARKKPRNGKIENADIRENAEVSHACSGVDSQTQKIDRVRKPLVTLEKVWYSPLLNF